jgi:hypothetical protein
MPLALRLLLGLAILSMAARAHARTDEPKEGETTPAPEPAKADEESTREEPLESEPKRTEPEEKPPSAAAFATYTMAEGFRLKSEDGDYMLRFRMAAGIKYEPLWTDGDPQKNGMFAFLRPSLAGHFFKPWVRYAFVAEFASPVPLPIAALVEVNPWDAFGLRIGQQVTPVSRHNSFLVEQIFFADFASVASYFWSGRQKGLTLFGSVLDGKLDYWAALYGGSPLREQTSNPHTYVGEGRVTASPMGPVNVNELPFTPDGRELPLRASVTLQGYHGEVQLTGANIDPTNSPLDPVQTPLLQTISTGGADLWLQWGRFILFGEYFQRYSESTPQRPGVTAKGAWGQLIANAWANRIGVGGRLDWIDPSSELSNDQVVEVEGQVAWFIRGPALALKLRYAWLNQSSPDPTTLGTFVLPFAPGITNLLTLQLNLAF